MSRLFGYLVADLSPEQSAEARRYIASQRTNGVAAETACSPSSIRADADCVAPRTFRSDGVVLGLAGACIWRGETISDTNSDRILSQLADRYRNAGAGFLAELEGPFALAIIEPAHRRALLAIDRMGIESLAYAQYGEGIIFSTSANAVAGFPGVSRSLRNQALFDFLFLHMVPAPDTVFDGIMKLPLATALHFDNGRMELRRYWQPTYEYARRSDFDDLKSTLRAALENGVRASGVDGATGAFLSGGLDSSSVAGTLAATVDSPARTFTVGFGDTEYDELKFARTANRHFGTRAFEYQMRPSDIVDAFPRIAAAYDEPFGNSSAAPTYFCAKLAADNGVTHVLGGDGGDELFGGNERYVRQWTLELYQRLPRWIRHGFLEPATRPISPESWIAPIRKVRSYVDQAQIPLPDRFESWNFMYREGGDHMLDPDFAASIDREGPMRRLREVWDSAPSSNLLERMLWYDWHFTLADNDLRKVNTMAALAGVRMSYPMLHPDVVNLSTRVPPNMKIQGKELRSFFKRAMADFLPREIIQKKKHGFGLPFGLWLKTDRALGDLIYSQLSDLKLRRIISADFIDNLIEQHRTGHPSYFGYAIWDLAMLEAWMAHHIGPA